MALLNSLLPLPAILLLGLVPLSVVPASLPDSASES